MNPVHQFSATWKQREIFTYFISHSSLHLTGHFCSNKSRIRTLILHSQTHEQDFKAPQIHPPLQTPSYYWHFSVSRDLKSIAIKISINCQVNSYYLANYLLSWVSCKCYPPHVFRHQDFKCWTASHNQNFASLCFLYSLPATVLGTAWPVSSQPAKSSELHTFVRKS